MPRPKKVLPTAFAKSAPLFTILKANARGELEIDTEKQQEKWQRIADASYGAAPH
jgi:hypothetical protein